MSKAVKVKAHTRVGRIAVREHMRLGKGPHSHVGSGAYMKAAKTDLFQKAMSEHQTKQAKTKAAATKQTADAAKQQQASDKSKANADNGKTAHKIEIHVKAGGK